MSLRLVRWEREIGGMLENFAASSSTAILNIASEEELSQAYQRCSLLASQLADFCFYPALSHVLHT